MGCSIQGSVEKSRADLRFILDGEVKTVRAIDPTLTVLEFLRSHERRTGAKEGCAEGDCGACTVALGELQGDRVAWRAVNACILFTPVLDGRALATVESLSRGGELDPLQQSLADLGGSQCGFCTPGIVMSLYARRETPVEERPSIEDSLAGNLCRCTGYGPILAAGETLGGPTPCEATAALLKEIQTDAPLDLDSGGEAGRRFVAPKTLAQLDEVLAGRPEAVVLAGGTDVGLWVTKQRRALPLVVSLREVAELAEIGDVDGALRIGAAVRYEALQPVLASLYPDMGEVIRRLGSAQIRAMGTVGGNIANGSPIGDMPPLLIAAGAELELRRNGVRRRMPLEDFFLEYGVQDRAPGEIVEAVILPKPRRGQLFKAYKVSKRFDQDISAVCAAFSIDLAGGVVQAARLAFGGMAGVPARARAAEAALEGSSWSEDTVRRATGALAEDFTPLTDHRGSAAYRLAVARNLLMKAFVEHGAKTASRVLDLAPVESARG